MERLQVKYVTTEAELNEFLSTLFIGNTASFPKLLNISYIPKVEGNGTETATSIGSTVIAAVQYIVEVE